MSQYDQQKIVYGPIRPDHWDGAVAEGQGAIDELAARHRGFHARCTSDTTIVGTTQMPLTQEVNNETDYYSLSGDTVTVNKDGMYRIDVDVSVGTVVSSGSSVSSIHIYKNGDPLAYASTFLSTGF